MKDNKLIAEFMGYRVFGNKCRKPMPYSLKGWLVDDIAPMQFHTEWNWLMPVVERIEEIAIDDTNLIVKEHRYHVNTEYTECSIYDTVNDVIVSSGDMGNKLLSTYQAVVEFLKNNKIA